MKMKLALSTLACLLSLGASFASGQHQEAEEHGDAHAIVTPNGGRLVTSIQPHAEILIADDGHVKITFLDDSGAVIASTGQDVSLIAGDRNDPIKLSFAAEGAGLVSDGTLPVDKAIPVVIAFKSSPDAKPVRERFTLNMGECPSCDNKEYACACHDD